MTSIIYQDKTYSIPEFLSRGDESPFIADIKKTIQEWQEQQIFHLFTSGSTGRPVQYSFKREQLIISARQSIRAFGLEKGDALHLCLSPRHAAGFMMIIRALYGKMRLIIEEASAQPQKYREADFTAFVPLQLENILQSGENYLALNRMKAIIVGGAGLSDHLIQQLDLLETDVYHTFGMTETLTHFAVKKLNNNRDKYFKLLPGNRIRQDRRGCLVVSGAVTNHKELVTNDLVHIHDEDRFEWLGRIDHIVNSGGVKIQLDTLEKKIESLLKRSGFFLHNQKDDRYGESIIMITESFEDRQTLHGKLKNGLHKYEVPKEIIIVDKIHKTESGKIDRRKTLEGLSINL